MSWPATAALCVLAIVAAPQAATAAGFFEVEPPSSFPANDPLGRSVAREAARAPHFPERAKDSGANAYAAQGEGALYVWWAVGEPTDDPATAIRSAFDRIRRGPVEASPQAGSVEIETWDEGLDDDIAGAELAWRHLSNETLTLVRTLAFAGPDGAPRLVAAECVMHVSREDDVRPVCEEALASLAITVAASGRGALDELPEGEPVEVSATVPDFASEFGDGVESGESDGGEPTDGPQISAPEDGVLYEQRDPGNGEDDPPWLLFAGGLLVAAAAYFTLRRRTARDARPTGSAGRERAHDEEGSTGEPD